MHSRSLQDALCQCFGNAESNMTRVLVLQLSDGFNAYKGRGGDLDWLLKNLLTGETVMKWSIEQVV